MLLSSSEMFYLLYLSWERRLNDLCRYGELITNPAGFE